jgi:general secretion pathway protein G
MKAFSLKGGENMFIKLLKKMRSQKGFTLIELVFVVVILAILAGVALINLGGTDKDAKIAAAKSDLRTLSTALKVYKAKEGKYPDTLAALTSDGASGYKPMIDSIPDDPSNAGHSYDYSTSSGNPVLKCSDTSYPSMTLK